MRFVALQNNKHYYPLIVCFIGFDDCLTNDYLTVDMTFTIDHTLPSSCFTLTICSDTAIENTERFTLNFTITLASTSQVVYIPTISTAYVSIVDKSCELILMMFCSTYLSSCIDICWFCF